MNIKRACVICCAPLFFIGISCHVAAETEIAVYAKGGTLGVGGGVGVALSNAFRARGEYTTYNYSPQSIETENITYDPDLDIRASALLLDWHPFRGNFRLTGGAIFNGNELLLRGQPAAGSAINYRGRTYSMAQVASLDGKVDFESTAPYVGFGWGDALDRAGHFTLLADIGVMFQGNGDVQLNTTCNGAQMAAMCAQIDNAVNREKQAIKNELADYRYWPVLNVGIGYRF